MSKKLSKIKIVAVGRKLTATIEGKIYPSSPTEEDKKKIIKAIESYNLLPSDNKKAKIIKLLTAKTIAKEELIAAERKIVKRAIKKADLEVKKIKKALPPAKATVDKDIENYLEGDKRFILRDGQVYLAPYVQVPMPEMLVERIKLFMTSNTPLESLINFWKLTLLNPNPIARTKLFDYLMRQNLIITPKGYFVTYRMVKTTDEAGVYTSAHTGKEKYKMGEAFSIPRSECDEDGSKDCSRGIHTGTPKFIGIMHTRIPKLEEGKTVGEGYGKGSKWVTTKAKTQDSFGTGYDAPAKEVKTQQHFDNSFGNQAVICLINPMHVVSVPNSDTRKMRSCEIYFCGTTTAEEVIDHIDKDYLIFDDKYGKYESDQLDKLLKVTKLQKFIDNAAVAKSEATKTTAIAKLNALRQELKVGQDGINSTLSMEDINSIIKSRIQK